MAAGAENGKETDAGITDAVIQVEDTGFYFLGPVQKPRIIMPAPFFRTSAGIQVLLIYGKVDKIGFNKG